MIWLGLTVVVFLLLGGAWWYFVRYYKHVQETTDRRYPQNSDDGAWTGGS